MVGRSGPNSLLKVGVGGEGQICHQVLTELLFNE
jgi:hypothetical protein